MTVTYQIAAAGAGGTTSATPAYPTGVVSGELVICLAGGKPYTSIPTCTNFTLLDSSTDGATASGNGVGSVVAAAFAREAAGSLSGTETVAITSGSPTMGRMLRFSKDAGETWSYKTHGGNDEAATGTTIVGGASLFDHASIDASSVSLAYGNGVYVSASTGGGINTSSDAITWSASSAVFANTADVIFFAAANLFIGIGGGSVKTSTDGATWTERTTIDNVAASRATNSATVAVVAAGSTLKYSTDGTTWTTATWPFGAGYTASDLGYESSTGTYYMACSASSGDPRISISTNGTTWANTGAIPLGGTTNVTTVGFDGTTWLAKSNTLGAYSTATDPASFASVTWTGQTFSSFSIRAIDGVWYLSGSGRVKRSTTAAGLEAAPEMIVSLPYSASSYSGTTRMYKVNGKLMTGATRSTHYIISIDDSDRWTAGDVLVLGATANDDANAHTAQSVSVPGLTLGTVTWLTNFTTTSGNDGALMTAIIPVTSGTATDGLTYTATAVTGKSTTALTVTRIRAASAAAIQKTGSDTGNLTSTESGSVAGSAVLSAADTGNITGTDAASSLASSSTVNDTGNITATETSSSISSLSRTDAGNITSTETASLFIQLSASDSGNLTSTETSEIVKSISASDSGNLTSVESSSAVISAAVSGSDTGNVTSTETSQSAVSSTRSDTGNVTATDTSAVASSSSLSDSGNITSTETSSLAKSSNATDSGTLSAVESASILVFAQVVGSDSGNITGVDASQSSSTIAVSDTGSISAAESTEVFKQISASDSGTLSATDSSTLTALFTVNDSGNITATDASSVSASGSFTASGADSGNITSVETASTFITLSPSDSGTLSAVEVATVFVVSVASDSGSITGADSSSLFKAVSVADSGSITSTESSVVFNDRPGADSGVLSATEISNVTITGTISKAGADSGTISGLDISNAFVMLSLADGGDLVAIDDQTIFITLTVTDSGTLLATLESANAFDPSSGRPVKVMRNGVMVDSLMRMWNGTQFFTPTIWRWNGTAFVEV